MKKYEHLSENFIELVGTMPSLLDLSLENNNIKDIKPLNTEENFKNLKVKFQMKIFRFIEN